MVYGGAAAAPCTEVEQSEIQEQDLPRNSAVINWVESNVSNTNQLFMITKDRICFWHSVRLVCFILLSVFATDLLVNIVRKIYFFSIW